MIKLRKETEARIRAYAKKRGIEPPEAADKIVDGCFSRWAALAKYAQKQKAPKTKKGGKSKAKRSALRRAA